MEKCIDKSKYRSLKDLENIQNLYKGYRRVMRRSSTSLKFDEDELEEG